MCLLVLVSRSREQYLYPTRVDLDLLAAYWHSHSYPTVAIEASLSAQQG